MKQLDGLLLDALYISCDVAEIFHMNYASAKLSSCWRARHCESHAIFMNHML